MVTFKIAIFPMQRLLLSKAHGRTSEMIQKPLKMTETLAYGYSTESTCESYAINTNTIGFGWFSKILGPCA